MSGPHDLVPPGSPREWIEHARSDLALARLGRDAEDVLSAQVCFHAQQAVEKTLKAVLLHRSVAFPLTHDLVALAEIATNAGIVLPDWRDELSGLNPTPSRLDIRDGQTRSARAMWTKPWIWRHVSSPGSRRPPDELLLSRRV